MKNLFYPILLLVGAAFMVTSCETEPGEPGDPNATPPLVTLDGSAVTLEPGQGFIVNVSAVPGDADLKDFAVYEDGVLIDATRILIDGAVAPANPIVLFDSNKTGFNSEVTIESHLDAAIRDYTFEFTDENNNTDSRIVTVTTELVVVNPTITYMGAMDVNVPPGTLVEVELSATAGSSPMSTVAVYENGELITDVTRLFYGDLQTGFDANPFAVPAADQNGFMKSVFIKTSNSGGANSYEVRVADADGNSGSASLNVTTGTAISNTLVGVLLNSAGPAGTGGLDLDTGIGTGSSDALAEIRDNGIDTSLPVAENWLRTISGVNGYTVKLVTPGSNGLPESFTFESVTFAESIVDAWATGEDAVWKLDPNDLYVVSNGTKYFLLKVTSINETTDNNEDSYTFDVKF